MSTPNTAGAPDNKGDAGAAEANAKPDTKVQGGNERQAESSDSHSSRHDTPLAYWHIANEKVRGPLGKLFLAGAIAINPIVAGTVYVGDKIARKTISKVPVVREVYEKPRAALVGTGTFVRDAMSQVLTSPVAAIDIVEDIHEVYTNTRRKESPTGLGRIREFITERLALVAKGATDMLKSLGGKGLEAAKTTLTTIASICAAPFKASYNISHEALGHVPYVSHASKILSVPIAIGGGLLAGYGGAAMLGMTEQYVSLLKYVWSLIQTLPSYF